jgi:histidyl-tRNA synthetase
VGGTTDVVQKEMYTFNDKGGRSVTMRPEGTSGCVRAFLEHGLFNQTLPFKACYLTSCYRYEKPQAGRLREFHQFGAECFGPAHFSADAEIISLAANFLASLRIGNLRLEINSIGCPDCRPSYHTALRKYFEGKKGELCTTCRERLERNPMRILDCKNPVCREIAAGAPVALETLCDGCSAHFEGLKAGLTVGGLEYVINPAIVRGLDYYTRTVFEFISGDLGAQSTVCGGGRYDGLLAELGGQPLPALGFAIGLERALMIMEKQEVNFPKAPPCNLYIAALGEEAALKAAQLRAELHEAGFSAETDVMGRSLKAQMKYADKLGALYTYVLGEKELAQGKAELKDMKTGETETVEICKLTKILSIKIPTAFPVQE